MLFLIDLTSFKILLAENTDEETNDSSVIKGNFLIERYELEEDVDNFDFEFI